MINNVINYEWSEFLLKFVYFGASFSTLLAFSSYTFYYWFYHFKNLAKKLFLHLDPYEISMLSYHCFCCFQFQDIGSHGTKIIIFNLWLNDEGIYELSFDDDDEVC